MSKQPRMVWTEPLDYLKAKRALGNEMTWRGRFVLFLFVTLLFLMLTFFVGDSEAVAKNISIAVIGGFILVYPLLWVISFIPGNAFVNKNGIGSGRTVVPFKKIKLAVVGSVEMGGSEFPVLMFETTDNLQYTYGLSNKVAPMELSDMLVNYGVNVE